MVIDFEELDRLEAEAGAQVRTAGCGPGASLPPGFIPREKLVSSYTLADLAATYARGSLVGCSEEGVPPQILVPNN